MCVCLLLLCHSHTCARVFLNLSQPISCWMNTAMCVFLTLAWPVTSPKGNLMPVCEYDWYKYLTDPVAAVVCTHVLCYLHLYHTETLMPPPSSEWGSYWPPLTLARRQVSCRLVASDTYVTALIYDTHINPDIVSDCVVNTQPQQLMDSELDNTAAMTVLFSVNDGQKSQPSPVSGSIFVCRLQQWTVTSEHLSWLCAVFFFFAVVLMVTWLQRFCRKVQRTTAVLTGSL